MIKHHLESYLETALQTNCEELNLQDVAAVLNKLRLERPRQKDHGDYAVNVSPLAKDAKMSPAQIVACLEPDLKTDPEVTLTPVGGFINFGVSDLLLGESLLGLLQTDAPGQNTLMTGEKILLEYVSANPTGPLHIGHGRWAALGDSLARIWRHCGAQVTPEFYINDQGVQMDRIGYAIYLQALNHLQAAQKIQVTMPLEEPPYPGEYVSALAEKFLAEMPDAEGLILAIYDVHQGLSCPLEETMGKLSDQLMPLKSFAKELLLAEQQQLLNAMGVYFESWFSEKELLHDRHLVEKSLKDLRHDRFCYEKDGALWLQSTDFGDEKDRVLVKSDGSYTYLSADIAYHHHKFSRVDDDDQPQYSRIVNIWGADHHGYIPRMRAAMVALDHLRDVNDPRFEIILGQLVNLIVDGAKERMGKRRKMLTLQEVVDEVGVDATRFWMVSKSADTALDFDVALAKSASHDNPVFYAQYAHARCASILRNAVHPTQTDTQAPEAYLSAESLKQLSESPALADLLPLFNPNPLDDGTDLLSVEAKGALRALILRLDSFEDTVQDAARFRAPHVIARYCLDLAGEFHSFYNLCRILIRDEATTRARLALILAIQKVLAQALALLGVSAPESM